MWKKKKKKNTSIRVVCPKFGHPVLSSKFYNDTFTQEFLAAASIKFKKKSPFESCNVHNFRKIIIPVQNLRF